VRQIAARKFVPGAGWGQIQLISAEGDYPSLSVAPHGEAQVVYFEGHTALARTLNPWLDTWSEPVALLQEIAYPTFPTLVSGDGYAFALINSDRGLEATIRQFGAARHLARYDHDGWRPATPVSDPSKVVVRSDFIASGENAAFVTREASFEFGGNQGEDTIEWLTGPPRRVVLPKNGCQLSMTPDNTVLAACEVQGEEVPGCFVGSRYGPYPVYYSYLESSLLRDDGTWTTPEIVTDVHRHIYFPRQFVDTSGNSYIASISNIPCQIDSSRVVARARAARRSSWQPEEIFDTFELKDLAVFSGGLPSFDAAVDPSGRLRAVWQKTSLDSSMDPPVHSTLLTSELQVLRPHPGRAKSWP
jgi:hypothetical protein